MVYFVQIYIFLIAIYFYIRVSLNKLIINLLKIYKLAYKPNPISYI